MKKMVALLMICTLLGGCGSPNVENGAGGQINVYTRDASSGTREAFEKAVGFTGDLTDKAIEAASNGDMATKVGSDEYAIGYVSLSTDFNANQIMPLQFEGVVPSEENVLNGSYMMQRPFAYTTRAADDFENETKKELVAAFIDYLQNSSEGMLVVENAGGVVDKTKGVPWAELAKNHPVVSQDNSNITIVTAGSTSVEKTIKSALESFQPMAGNFQFVMNQTGSGDGWKRVLGSEKDGANKADIGFASRSFKSEEDTSKALLSGTYCQDAVVAVVNQNNSTVNNLTKEQLYDIFTGTINNWDAIEE